jgi:hypothetical protein
VENEYLRSDDDVEAILRLAVNQNAGSSSDLRARLMETASELGLSPEQVAAAEREYLATKEQEVVARSEEEEEARLWKEFRVRQRGDLISHLGSYLGVNAGLMAMDWFQGGGIDWAFWPLMGWGIAIVIHVFSFAAGTTEDSLDEFEKFKRKKRKSSGSSD